jgi:D-tyrosyl-tRNA(Tyr) deacylase
VRAVVQRVSRAEVRVRGKTVGRIDEGLLVFVGVGKEDTEKAPGLLADKVCNLRVFQDSAGKMNLSVIERKGAVLAIPQFTLFGDARQGRRPSYSLAAAPHVAAPLFQRFVQAARDLGLRVESGMFQETMEVESTNAGPVTILIDTTRLF